MKIFIYNKEVFMKMKTNTYSSVVLVGDNDQIYHHSVNKNNDDRFVSTINNIKRALIFVRNNKPLYCNNNIEIFTNVNRHNEIIDLENRIFNDEYIDSFKKTRNQDINLMSKIKNNIDIEYINFARTLVDVKIRNDYAKNLIKSKER